MSKLFDNGGHLGFTSNYFDKKFHGSSDDLISRDWAIDQLSIRQINGDYEVGREEIPNFGHNLLSSPNGKFLFVTHDDTWKSSDQGRIEGNVELYTVTETGTIFDIRLTGRQVLDNANSFSSSSYLGNRLRLLILDANDDYALIAVQYDAGTFWKSVVDGSGNRYAWLWRYPAGGANYLDYEIRISNDAAHTPSTSQLGGPNDPVKAGSINNKNEYIIGDLFRENSAGYQGEVHTNVGDPFPTIEISGAGRIAHSQQTLTQGAPFGHKTWYPPEIKNNFHGWGVSLSINDNADILIAQPRWSVPDDGLKTIGRVMLVNGREYVSTMTSDVEVFNLSQSTTAQWIYPRLDGNGLPLDGKYGTSAFDANGLKYPTPVQDLTDLSFGDRVKWLTKRSNKFIIGARMDNSAPGYLQMFKLSTNGYSLDSSSEDIYIPVKICTINNPIVDGMPDVLYNGTAQVGSWEDKKFGRIIEVDSDEQYLYTSSLSTHIRTGQVGNDPVAPDVGVVYVFKIEDLERNYTQPYDIITSDQGLTWFGSPTDIDYENDKFGHDIVTSNYAGLKRVFISSNDIVSSNGREGNIYAFKTSNKVSKKNSGIWSINSTAPSATLEPYIDNVSIPSSVDEGSNLQISFDAYNLVEGKLYHYHYIGYGPDENASNYADFGSVVSHSSSGFTAPSRNITGRLIQVRALADTTTEGPEVIENCRVIISGSSDVNEHWEHIGNIGPFSFTINDTSKNESVTPAMQASYNENVQFTVVVNTVNRDDTNLYWSIDRASGSTRNDASTDFDDNGGTIVRSGILKENSQIVNGEDIQYQLLGYISSGSTQATPKTTRDYLTEGSETFYLKVWEGGVPAEGNAGTLVAEQSFIVNDTSTDIIEFTMDSSFNEGDTVTVTFRSSRQLTNHWASIAGTTTPSEGPIDASDLTGFYGDVQMTYTGSTQFGDEPTVYSFTASWTIDSDQTTEGDEAFVVWITEGSAGPIGDALAFQTATVVDTSLTPVAGNLGLQPTNGIVNMSAGSYSNTTYTLYDITTEANAAGVNIGDTIRLVFRYHGFSNYFGDVQLDQIAIGDKVTSFASSTTSGNFIGYGQYQRSQSPSNVSDYSAVTWETLTTGTATGKWNVDAGGTPSSSTGLTTDYSGSSTQNYVYAEVSSQTYTQNNFMWLRSPELTWTEGSLAFRRAASGSTMGQLTVYIDKVADGGGGSGGGGGGGTDYSEFVSIGSATAAVDSDTYMGGTADYNGPYYVYTSNPTTNVGNGKRFYLAHKTTSPTTYFSDLPIGGVQHFNSSGTLLNSWIFYSQGGGSGSTWQTTTSTSITNISSGFSIAAETYGSIGSTATANIFSFATSTGSSNTGAAGGISSSFSSTAMEPGSAANSTVSSMAQIGTNFFMFRETSGSTLNSYGVARSPLFNVGTGDYFKIAYVITHPSTSRQDPDDCLFMMVR